MKPCPECAGTGEVTEEHYEEIMSDLCNCTCINCSGCLG